LQDIAQQKKECADEVDGPERSDSSSIAGTPTPHPGDEQSGQHLKCRLAVDWGGIHGMQSHKREDKSREKAGLHVVTTHGSAASKRLSAMALRLAALQLATALQKEDPCLTAGQQAAGTYL
jgi:hypothetical protein